MSEIPTYPNECPHDKAPSMCWECLRERLEAAVTQREAAEVLLDTARKEAEAYRQDVIVVTSANLVLSRHVHLLNERATSIQGRCTELIQEMRAQDRLLEGKEWSEKHVIAWLREMADPRHTIAVREAAKILLEVTVPVP